MKAIIMAAGSHRKFDRKTIKINNETLIDRLVRQLFKKGIINIQITAAYQGQHSDIKNIKEIINPLTGNNLGCLYGIKDYAADFYFYSDVFYSNDAIDLIIHGNTTYYGRVKSTPLKSYGEFFAFKQDPEMWKWLELCWSAYQDKKIDRLWSWDLYAYHTKKWTIDESPIPRKRLKREQYLIVDNFTEINDWTDDFDSQEDLDKWVNFYRGLHD